MYQHFFKRLLDIFGATIALVILAIPFIFIAILIRLDSTGPAFFRQRRMGKLLRFTNFEQWIKQRLMIFQQPSLNVLMIRSHTLDGYFEKLA